MAIIIPSEALRVARALLNLTRSDLAEGAELAEKTIQRAEAGLPTARASERLQAFYEQRGISFTGSVDLATGAITGAGARWRSPTVLPPDGNEGDNFKTESFGVHFRAARAWLDKSQRFVAGETALTQKTIIALEQAGDHVNSDFRRLREYYEGKGIEFLSWGDTSRNVYYGVGVRRKQMTAID
ncbi:XRE family transcriptional regulator [Rhizobium leguminosarum]|uniref:XRE family transcriptional regulator n=1 Tax=Rhizobium leguminosarum TaxID=384 RepID=UPI0010300389|nr:XRE family transcriptional regulator [Rhizobium leguminosarum]TAY13994.1 XRE family transcriptional regulator [Rhizobium leguminosarum]